MSRLNVIYTAKTLGDLLSECERTLQLLRAQHERIIKNGLETEGFSLAHTATIERGLAATRQMSRDLSARIDLRLDVHGQGRITSTISQRKPGRPNSKKSR